MKMLRKASKKKATAKRLSTKKGKNKAIPFSSIPSIPHHVRIAQLKKQRPTIPTKPDKNAPLSREYVVTGIEGFDNLMEHGIPKGSSVLICGGPGSGKTIFALQTTQYLAKKGKKVMYMTFEETPNRLREHMIDFGWDPLPLERSKNLLIKQFSPFDITRQVEALLAKAKGELMIDVKPVLFHKGFNPDIVVIDSLTSIASSFIGKEDTFRIYLEQMFNLLSETKTTSFLISERTDGVAALSTAGVDEFLADGLIFLYSIKHGNVRENSIEILKMRGANFQKKIVPLRIEKTGIVVYPEQEVFS